VDQFRPALAQLAAETPTLPCTFASLGAFPTEEGVIFLAPTASQALLHLEEHVLDHLGTFGAEVSPYFRAGSWVPHCTLAIGIQRDHMAAAFGVCFEAFHPISGQLIQLALAEISTGGPGYSFDLGRASK
jgi:2'-5' RNA ligase